MARAPARTPAPPPVKDAAAAQFHLVHGEDEYQVSETARALVNQLCPEDEQVLGLEVIEGRADNATACAEALRRCREALLTVGFFGGRKVVWLKDLNYYSNGNLQRSDEPRAQLAALGETVEKGLAPEQYLVISAMKVDGRSSLFKTAKSHGRLYTFTKPKYNDQADAAAGDWVRQRLRAAGLRAERPVIQALVERVGTDSRQILAEVEKLAAYKGDAPEVTMQDISEVVVPSRESAGWDLVDAFAKRDLPGALMILRRLTFQRQSVHGLVAMLETRLRELTIMRTALDRGWVQLSGSGRYLKAAWEDRAEVDEACSRLGADPREIHPYRQKLLLEQARGFNLRKLVRAQALTLATHDAIQSTGIDPALQMEFLLIRLLGAPKRRT